MLLQLTSANLETFLISRGIWIIDVLLLAIPYKTHWKGYLQIEMYFITKRPMMTIVVAKVFCCIFAGVIVICFDLLVRHCNDEELTVILSIFYSNTWLYDRTNEVDYKKGYFCKERTWETSAKYTENTCVFSIMFFFPIRLLIKHSLVPLHFLTLTVVLLCFHSGYQILRNFVHSSRKHYCGGNVWRYWRWPWVLWIHGQFAELLLCWMIFYVWKLAEFKHKISRRCPVPQFFPVFVCLLSPSRMQFPAFSEWKRSVF